MFNSRKLRNAVLVATVAVLATGGAMAAESARPRRGAGAGMMSAIPSQSLVCVRINRFDATLDSVNAFLQGFAPDDFDAKAHGQAQQDEVGPQPLGGGEAWTQEQQQPEDGHG